MSILGGAIAGGLGLLSGAGNWFSTNSTNKANRQLAEQQNQWNLQYQQNEFNYNQQQSELEWERNLEQWYRQNEYNSPSAQMQRYIEAGLNPNLIYGNGQASAGNAASSPSFQSAKFSAPSAERSTDQVRRIDVDPYQLVSISNQLGLQQAQKDQISAQADYTRQNTINATLESSLKTLALAKEKHLEPYFKELAITRVEQARAELSRTSNQSNYYQSMFGLNDLRGKLTDKQIDYIEEQIKHLRTANDLDALKLKLEQLGLGEGSIMNNILRIGARFIADPSNFLNKFNF